MFSLKVTLICDQVLLKVGAYDPKNAFFKPEIYPDVCLEKKSYKPEKIICWKSYKSKKESSKSTTSVKLTKN